MSYFLVFRPKDAKQALLLVLAVGVLGVHFWSISRGWLSPVGGLREAHNMVTIASLHAGGPLFRYESPIFGYPWSAPIEFPAYQWLSAQMAHVLEMGIAARTVSLLMFYLSLWMASKILKEVGFSSFGIFSFLAISLMSPIFIFYSRTPMIETTALFFSLAFFYGFVQILKGSKWRWRDLIWVCAFAVLAAVTKVTTAATFLLLSGLFLLFNVFVKGSGFVPWWRTKGTLLIPLVLAVLSEFFWARWTDEIKGLNPLAEYLTSKNSTGWVWGSWEMRTSVPFWRDLLFRTRTHDVIGARFVLVCTSVLVLTLKPRKILVFLGLIALFLVAPLLFANLHWVHRYYAVANGFFLIAAIAWVLGELSEDRGIKPWAAVLFLIVSLFLCHREYRRDWYGVQIRLDQMPIRVAEKVAEITRPNEVVLFRGMSYDGTAAYHAKRKAITDFIAFPDHEARMERSARMLPAETPLTAAVLCGDDEQIRRYREKSAPWVSVGPVIAEVPYDRSPNPALRCEISRASRI